MLLLNLLISIVVGKLFAVIDRFYRLLCKFLCKATTDVNDPKYKEDQITLKAFYENAKPCYEKARELKPDQKDLWLNGLYRVYYNLDMGPEFEEIEKLM